MAQDWSNTLSNPDCRFRPELTDHNKPPTPQQLVDFVFGIAAKYFPRLVPDESKGPQSY